MLDFSRLEQYRENNRIEAEKALGVSLSRAESFLQQLADEGIIVVETNQGSRLYKLKA